MRKPFPLSTAYNEFLLPVGAGHKIFVHEFGNPKGLPLIAFHGGPGGKSKPELAQYYNPKKYRIILFDQRGCGKSTFEDPLKENTIQNLIQDAESIRTKLKIEKWHVSGGSWGSTLALLYVETYPERCLSLIVRGIYLTEKSEEEWLFEGGAAKIFPDKYSPLVDFFAERGQALTIKNLADLILNGPEEDALTAAFLMSVWETAVGKLQSSEEPEEFPISDEDRKAELVAGKIMMHYVTNDCFLKPNEILDNTDKLSGIPGVIIHGRYDMVCPFENAWKLAQVWPEAELEIVPAAGHHGSEPGIASKAIEYSEKFSKIKAAV